MANSEDEIDTEDENVERCNDKDISKKVLQNRILEKNKIRASISSFEKNIERLKNSQNDLSNNSNIKDKEFIGKKINENNDNINELTDKIKDLKIKLEDIDKGDYDDEILENINKNTKIFQKHLNTSKQKKIDVSKKTKDFIDKNKEKNTQSNYTEKRLNNIMEKEYERYISFRPSDRILQNLKKMPNNKGYIICGHWFFGLNPEESKNLIMFENIQGTQYIHEYYYDKCITYKKRPNEQKKTFVKEVPRKKINGS